MTERIYTAEQLSELPARGVEALKIRALFNAYGGSYEFCRFFRQGSTYLACLAEFSRVCLMELRMPEKSGEELPECSPSEAWKVISTRFPIDFEPWYLDMSHRVRHGVSRCVSDGRSALVVQHSIGSESLISQVAVLSDFEGKGYAGGLLLRVCRALGGEIRVICEDGLTGFYEKFGFRHAGYRYCAARIREE